MVQVDDQPSHISCSNPKLWIKTPLVYSHTLSLRAGYQVYLKLDLLQPSGSFKSRGVGNLVLANHHRFPNTPLHFFSSSGGNAGLACIVAARTLGHPATVVTPLSTSPHMVTQLKAAGGHIVQHGESWMEADLECRRLLQQATKAGERGVYCPPFDHEDIWEGNKTLAEEIQEQLEEQTGRAPDAVVLSVGGGGMLVGVCRSLMPSTLVVGVETRGAHSLAASVEAGELVTLSRITSIARSLGARRVAEEAFRVVVEGAQGRGPRVESVVVEDEEAGMGCWRLAEEERMLVEPSCGASAAAVYNGSVKKLLQRGMGRGDGDSIEDKIVVLVVCGGSDVNLAMLEDWRKTFSHQVPWMQESVKNGA